MKLINSLNQMFSFPIFVFATILQIPYDIYHNFRQVNLQLLSQPLAPETKPPSSVTVAIWLTQILYTTYLRQRRLED